MHATRFQSTHNRPAGIARRELACLALLGLALLSAACASGEPAPTAAPTHAPTGAPGEPSPPAPTRTATTLPSPSHTADPVSAMLETRYVQIDQTRTAQALTPSATATLISTPRPSVTPEPSPTPAGTLAAGGPWLLLEQTRPDRSAPGVLPDTRQYLAANPDGSGLQQLRLPEPAEARAWLALPSERSSSLAFLQVLREGFSFYWYTARERYEPFLWIASLPENELVRQVPLLGPRGWEQVDRERERIANRVEIPLTLGLVSDPRSLLWSPDGSRLAFSSGTRGAAADIFLYTPQSSELLGVTNLRSVGAQPWFWSADGGWLVYRTGRRYTAQGFSRLSNTYALSMEPGSRPKKLYSPRNAEQVLGVTVLNFLVYEQVQGRAPCLLRRVDYSSGQVDVLYRGCFAQAAAEPGGAILLNFDQSPTTEQTAGIFRLDPRTRQLTLLLAGSYRLEPWDAQRRAFVAIPAGTAISDGAGPSLVFRVDGLGALVELNPAQIEIPSPNLRWRLRQTLAAGQDPGSLALLTAEGQTFTELGPGPWDKIRWSPDSLSFYALRCTAGNCALGFFQRALGWQPEWVLEIPGLSNFWIINP